MVGLSNASISGSSSCALTIAFHLSSSRGRSLRLASTCFWSKQRLPALWFASASRRTSECTFSSSRSASPRAAIVSRIVISYSSSRVVGSGSSSSRLLITNSSIERMTGVRASSKKSSTLASSRATAARRLVVVTSDAK